MKGQTIIAIVFASLLSAYVLFALIFFPTQTPDVPCKKVEITIEDQKQRAYVKPQELQQYVLTNHGELVGHDVEEIPLLSIEQTLLKHPMLREAEVWYSPEGVLHMEVEQREPVLRVMGGENYYVDSDRRRMPVRNTTAAYVPVVTGRVSQRFATGELYDFVCWMEQDNYWRAQIEQINVVSPTYIELVPRVGSGIVVLGNLDNYQGKLRKLKKLYTDGFSTFGWTDYAEIDLRFRGQVVCRR
ncbi:MAG: hypothetical protein IKN59_04720 [Paludibacteraceae bacterium]|nr:hypothetical protein [Paludibacteraceae bacterium]